MNEPISPLATYREHCRKGELAYQVTGRGRAVFFPRLVAPDGSEELTWRVSAGRGTVYAATAISIRGEAPYNVSLVDLDEGFRMMSRVEDVPAEGVRIGMRVKMRMHDGGGDVPYPVFVPDEEA